MPAPFPVPVFAHTFLSRRLCDFLALKRDPRTFRRCGYRFTEQLHSNVSIARAIHHEREEGKKGKGKEIFVIVRVPFSKSYIDVRIPLNLKGPARGTFATSPFSRDHQLGFLGLVGDGSLEFSS